MFEIGLVNDGVGPLTKSDYLYQMDMLNQYQKALASPEVQNDLIAERRPWTAYHNAADETRRHKVMETLLNLPESPLYQQTNDWHNDYQEQFCRNTKIVEANLSQKGDDLNYNRFIARAMERMGSPSESFNQSVGLFVQKWAPTKQSMLNTLFGLSAAKATQTARNDVMANVVKGRLQNDL